MTALITLRFSYQKQHRKSEHSLRHYWGLFWNSKGDTFEITRVFFLSRDIWETKDQHKHPGFFSPCPCGWSPLPVSAGLSPWPRVRVRQLDADRYIHVCRWGAAEIQSGWAAARPQLCVRSEPPGAEDWSPETHDGRSVLRSNVTLQTAAVLLISCLNVCFCIGLNTRRIQQQANHVLMTGLSRQVQRSVSWLHTHTHTHTHTN